MKNWELIIKDIWGIMALQCTDHHSSGVVAVVSPYHHFSRMIINMTNWYFLLTASC